MADPNDSAPWDSRTRAEAAWLRSRLYDLALDARRYRVRAEAIGEDIVAADLIAVENAITEAADDLQARFDAQPA